MASRGTALVTGGATRLGAGFALTLARHGYDIALHYHCSADDAAELADQIGALGQRCERLSFDFAAGDDPALLVERAADALGTLTVLVNSASTYAAATTARTDRELLQRQFAVNVFAPYLLTQAFTAHSAGGNVVNILDNKIAFQQYAYSAYLLSKKTLAEFTRMAAVEFAPRFRVNAIAPGVVLPAASRGEDYLAWREQGIPLARQGRVGELARALGYLLDNEFVTGQILYVDGGESVNQVGRHSDNYPVGSHSP